MLQKMRNQSTRSRELSFRMVSRRWFKTSLFSLNQLLLRTFGKITLANARECSKGFLLQDGCFKLCLEEFVHNYCFILVCVRLSLWPPSVELTPIHFTCLNFSIIYWYTCNLHRKVILAGSIFPGSNCFTIQHALKIATTFQKGC